MADEALKVERREWEAGAEYLAALRKLGLEPEVLAWGFCGPDSRMELVLVSSWVDTVGPKALYDLLFAAYDASATPKAIDPFVVSVYSPKSVLGDELAGMIDHAERGPALPNPILVLAMGEVLVPVTMVYTAKRSRRSKMEELRRFKRFEREVTALAA